MYHVHSAVFQSAVNRLAVKAGIRLFTKPVARPIRKTAFSFLCL